MEEHSQVIGGLEVRFGRLEDRVGHLEDRVDSGFERVDRAFERVDQRFDTLDSKTSRQFNWLAGILMSGMIAMVSALVAIVLRP